MITGPWHVWENAEQDFSKSLWDWPEENLGWIQGHVWCQPTRGHNGMTMMCLHSPTRKSSTWYHGMIWYIMISYKHSFLFSFKEWHWRALSRRPTWDLWSSLKFSNHEQHPTSESSSFPQELIKKFERYLYIKHVLEENIHAEIKTLSCPGFCLHQLLI